MTELEAVCVCAHVADQHLPGGPCSICKEPPCLFFVLRFHRETFRLVRSSLPDPVGHYWSRAPKTMEAWAFSQLSVEDRREVASICFQEANFNPVGGQECYCKNNCVEEYLCEVIACFLLIPWGSDLGGPVDELARIFDVEPWVVRFRKVLEEQEVG